VSNAARSCAWLGTTAATGFCVVGGAVGLGDIVVVGDGLSPDGEGDADASGVVDAGGVAVGDAIGLLWTQPPKITTPTMNMATTPVERTVARRAIVGVLRSVRPDLAAITGILLLKVIHIHPATSPHGGQEIAEPAPVSGRRIHN
jgi:hypothetical protein